MKILMTAFDPFGGDTKNAAMVAVENAKAPAGAQLVKVLVPTVFGLAAEKLHEAICAEDPDVVVCVGEASLGSPVTPERVAINVMDARIPDNAGNQPVDQPVFADGPAAYFTKLPIKAMVDSMKAAGFNAAVSNSAGTFVCNSLMYSLLYFIDREFPQLRGGFIHVPADRDGSPTSGNAITEALKVL